LREKNQVTIPKVIADALGFNPGDRLLFVADQAAESLHIYRARASYAGVLAGVYGTPLEAAEYATTEREAWGE
jgi:AbrB family looped-hinge helix DNA binding protein